MPKLTGAASRAARALLRWSMRELVDRSGVSLPTILKLENDGTVSADTAEKIVALSDTEINGTFSFNAFDNPSLTISRDRPYRCARPRTRIQRRMPRL